MQNNFYVLRQLVKELNPVLDSARLIACFSQDKEELIMQFLTKSGENFFIKAHLRANLSCLSFPNEFARAKRNSANLFEELVGIKVCSVQEFKNDRSFVLRFENDKYLLFKLHGNRGNIVLLDSNGRALKLFRSKLVKDLSIDLNGLAKSFDLESTLDEKGFVRLDKIPTLDKRLRQYLEDRTKNSSPDEQLRIVSNFLNQLENEPEFYVNDTAGKIKFSLFQEEATLFKSTSAIEALNYFFNKKIRVEALTSEKTKVKKNLQEHIKRTGTYLIKVKSKLRQLEQNDNFRQNGDILMANVHLKSVKEPTITLFNFYTNKEIEIKVNPALSIQANAERYYRKAKNLNIEIEVMKKNIQAKETLLLKLEEELEQVDQIDNIKQLKKPARSTPAPAKHDFKEVIIDDYVVLIGKNAKQNDLLTLKFAKPNDTWLHAKDVTGSHVVIKEKPGQNIPKYVLEEAASYAAYYSKRKTDTLCPVIFTKKKYVRKKKGLPPGAVIVEKEQILLVAPAAPQ